MKRLEYLLASLSMGLNTELQVVLLECSQLFVFIKSKVNIDRAK